MRNDGIYGFLMVLIAVVGIVFEGFYLIIAPLTSRFPEISNLTETPIYWALALPIFLASFGLLVIIGWIGYTLIVTPPPESWDFEGEEDKD